MTQEKSSGSPSGGQESKVQAVREQTTDVGQNVMQAGGQVTQTAVGQGKQVAAETGRQARGMLDQAYSRVREEAHAQQNRAAERLRALGDELQSMCGQGERQDMAGTIARQASGRAHQMADWLQQREPGAIVNEVRDYARRHPGMFLAGAAIAGAVAGRLTRSIAASSGMGGGMAAGGGERGGGQPANQPPSGQPAGQPIGHPTTNMPVGQFDREPGRMPQPHTDGR